MTYLVHNKTLFELYTACSAVTHFPQFSSTSALTPDSAVTVAEGGRHPWATLSEGTALRCTASDTVKNTLLDPEPKLLLSISSRVSNQPRHAK